VELGTAVASLDPAGPGSAGQATSTTKRRHDFGESRVLAKLSVLVYDRLVRLDSMGAPQPALAISWEHDGSNARWRFKLRPGVRWQDGEIVTAAEVAAALDEVAANHPWSAPSEDTLEIDNGSARPDFPMELATAPEAVVARQTAGAAGPPAGTGPFRVAEWDAGRSAVLVANEDYWGGRPYLDSIRVEMGASSRDRLNDLELDKADLVELDPPEARRAQQEARKVWVSAPDELVALAFNPSSPAARDRRIRQAVARSIDRSAIQRVLLQNYGEATGSLLPEWLSGFAFLFPAARDLEGALQLGSELGALPSLKLGYDASDTLARQVAERVAVNGRDAGIRFDVAPVPSGGSPWNGLAFDAVVERARIDGPTLRLGWRQCAEAFGFPPSALPPDATGDLEQDVYASEARLLDDFTLIPLVDAPELVGLGLRVRNWSAGRWSDWRLDDVWLAAKP